MQHSRCQLLKQAHKNKNLFKYLTGFPDKQDQRNSVNFGQIQILCFSIPERLKNLLPDTLSPPAEPEGTVNHYMTNVKEHICFTRT